MIARLIKLIIYIFFIQILHVGGMAESFTVGVPPGKIQYQIEFETDLPAIEINGTVSPPSMVINGQQIQLQKKGLQKKSNTVLVNGEELKSHGSVGHFYKRYEKPPEQFEIQIIHQEQVYEQKIVNAKYFFTSKYKKTWLNEKKQDLFQWKGVLPQGQDVYFNNQKIKRSDKNQIELPFELKAGQSSHLVRVVGPDTNLYFKINYRVQISKYTKNKPYLIYEDNDFDLNFRNTKFKFKTSPQTDVTFLNETKKSDSSVEFQYRNNCNQLLEQGQLTIAKGNSLLQEFVEFKNSDCKKFTKKHNSRVYLSYGGGHFGLIDAIDSDIDLLYTEYLSLGPKFALGIRLYQKFYAEVRGFNTRSFHNSKGDKSTNVGGGYFSVGYPFRGKYFAQVGVMNMNVAGYSNPDSPTLEFGLPNSKIVGVGLEFGRRWFLSPSWALTSRLFYTAPFLSFNWVPYRRWTFLIVEPIALEYTF